MSSQKLKSIAIYAVIVVLFISAVALGYLIYQQLSAGKSQSESSSQPVQSQKFVSTAALSQLSASQKALLMPLPKGANKADQESYFKIVNQLAKTTQPLNLNKCILPNPYVLKMKMGDSIAIKNDGDVDYNIRMSSGDGYTIPAKSTKNVKIAFKKGTGVYAYRCDGLNGVAGFFYAVR